MRRSGGEDADFGRVLAARGMQPEQGPTLVRYVTHPADDEEVGEAGQAIEGGLELGPEHELGADLGPDPPGSVVDRVTHDGDGREVVNPDRATRASAASRATPGFVSNRNRSRQLVIAGLIPVAWPLCAPLSVMPVVN